jgi:lipopolysaccharide transport system ATP-binding protein
VTMYGAAIRVEGLSKRYRIGRRQAGRTLREVLSDKLSTTFQRRKEPTDDGEFWALRDVSFEVERGEVLGIIGRNGAGKSTLLKILSRITEPTTGSAEIFGKIGSLLEVGTGFHPELTGRENIYLNGAILGMGRREIDRKFDEIVEFAEVRRFIDTAVKHYSSGMYVRLAFAVAAHLESEILIVDEVLAVGDGVFQQKCLGKIGEVAAGGRTVIFVSHNLAAVRALCRRVLVFDSGALVTDTEAETGIRAYSAGGASAGATIEWTIENAPAAPEFRFVAARVLDENGVVSSHLDSRRDFTLEVDYRVLRPLSGLRVGFFMQSSEGVAVCGSNDPEAWPDATRQPGCYTSRCLFPGNVFNAGKYSAYFGADVPPFFSPLVATPYCVAFTIEDLVGHGPYKEQLPGIVKPPLKWSVQRSDTD